MAATRRRGGWFLIDALLAMGVIIVLSVAFAASLRAHQKATDRLAASRESMRVAEQVLVALQSGATPPATPQGITVQIRAAAAADTGPAPDAPAGWTWVDVHVARGDGRSVNLCGIAPTAAATTTVTTTPTTAPASEAKP